MNATVRRNPFIDELRGYAILLVVIGHVLQFVIKVPLNGFAFAIIYSFHMPLFMFLSGYSLSIGHGDLKLCYVVKRMARLLVPFFVWGGAMVYVVHSVAGLADLVLNPAYGLWFLWCLAWITFFVWLGQRISLLIKSEMGYFLVLIVLTILDYILDSWCFAFNLIALHFIFFLLGYNLKKYWSDRSKDFKFFIKLCSVFLFFTLILFWRFPQTFILEKPVITFLKEAGFPRYVVLYMKGVFFVLKRYLVSVSGIIFVISISRFFHDILGRIIKRFIAFVGTRTLDVYSIHVFIVCLTPCLFSNKWLDALVKIILGITLPLVVGNLLRKNRWTNFLFLAGKIPSIESRHGKQEV